VRATGAMHFEDEMAFRSTGTWGTHLVSEEWNQKHFDANVEVSRYVSRVGDEEVRRLVGEIKDASIASITARSRQNAQDAHTRLVGLVEPTNKRIGELLRSLH